MHSVNRTGGISVNCLMMDSKETNWKQKMIKVRQLFIGMSFVAISACGGSNDYTDITDPEFTQQIVSYLLCDITMDHR